MLPLTTHTADTCSTGSGWTTGTHTGSAWHVAEPRAAFGEAMPGPRTQPSRTDTADDGEHPPMNRNTDPMRPPVRPRQVRCLLCEQQFESSAIYWRPEPLTAEQVRARAVIEAELCAQFGGSPRRAQPGDEHGRWCCPTSGCHGAGYLFDLLPVVGG